MSIVVLLLINFFVTEYLRKEDIRCVCGQWLRDCSGENSSL